MSVFRPIGAGQRFYAILSEETMKRMVSLHYLVYVDDRI